jgi:hypothetical protein
VIIRFIAKSIISSSQLEALSSPSRAFFDILISRSKRGMMIGKLRIAIRVAFPPALDAIPETIVKVHEKPRDPSMTLRMNNNWSCTGFPRTME